MDIGFKLENLGSDRHLLETTLGEQIQRNVALEQELFRKCAELADARAELIQMSHRVRLEDYFK